MKNKYLSILLALFGEGLLALIFFLLIPQEVLTDETRVLDFIVVSVIYGLWVYNIITPLVNLSDPARRQVGGLGIRWVAVGIYSVLALLLVLGNLIYSWSGNDPGMSFAIQAVIQGVLLFVLLGGLLSARGSEQKTAEIHEKEQLHKQGKQDVRAALSGLLFEMQETPGIPHEINERVKGMVDEVRYITPSSSAEALDIDSRIIGGCEILRSALYDYDINKVSIQARVEQIERDVQRRKQAF
ncbi:MAG: hypothetical protein K2N05_12145 [Muribaculaceae bacterium]|nr:hypothetical protein [Muribaculaceae bacterium]